MNPYRPRVQVSGAAGKMDCYCQAVRGAGGEPVPGYAPAPDLSCDSLILCGGDDMDPAWFGQENQGSQPPDPIRDKAELALFQAFFQAGKPILGICRGMQVLNVALGGTLIQDLPPELLPFHGGAERYLVHPIRTGADSVLDRLYGRTLAVNSWHHQAVDRLGEGLIPTAWAESGLVEAVEHLSLPILGVQFHPERMSYGKQREDAADGAPLMEYFLSLCRSQCPG